MDAIKLEMQNMQIAFEEFDGNPVRSLGSPRSQAILCLMSRSEKSFRERQETGAPASVTYSTMVSRNSVRILLSTISALNDLDILGADVQNAFLTAHNKEKCWMVPGPEFGSEEDKTFLVVNAL